MKIMNLIQKAIKKAKDFIDEKLCLVNSIFI